MTGTGFPRTFEHPATGPSQQDASHLAIRWAAGAGTGAKQGLIDELGLVPATLADDRRPNLAVNRTDALWWVRRADGSDIGADVLDRLGSSDLVEWVSPAYRAAGTDATAAAAPGAAGSPTPTLFAVNPTRVWVREEALPQLGLDALGSEPVRTSGIPGYTVLPVRSGTALTVMGQLAAAGAGPDTPSAVRLETVPFVSPATAAPARTATFTPDDPKFGLQWSLPRTQVPAAWEIVKGDPCVVIAILDEGVELGHPDLDVYPQSWNASTDTPDGSPTGNHGTACAGIAAARLDNGMGVSGVAGGCQVMAIATATWADVDIAEGLYFAADNGARVVSMSFGVYPEWNVWDFSLIRDALQHAYDRGLLLVAASGNEDGPVSRFPGSDSRTLCVGGSNRSDERKRQNDSSAEPWWGASYGPDVDVVAPCLQIPTTDRLGADGYDPGDYFDGFNGTSSATPLVAGIGGLLFSLRPDLNHVTARYLIESTCEKISPALYNYQNVAHKPSGTWNDQTGYGRVNALKAVNAAAAGAGAPAGVAPAPAADGATVVE
jgi:thermitase